MSDLIAADMNVLPATADDYEGVMAISEGIYMGVDYLPLRYPAWLKDPQRRMFVAKSDGRVVGFDSFLLVDGGITAVVQGLRVAPWMRGCGVAGVIQKFCFDTLRSQHPEVTRIRLTRSEDPPAGLLNKYRILHSKDIVSVFLSNEELGKALNILESRVPSMLEAEHNPPMFLGPSEVRALFEGPIKEDLLPGGFLVQGWLPITTHKSNLDLMERWKIGWLCTYPCLVTGKYEYSDVIDSCDGGNKKTPLFPPVSSSPDPTPPSTTFPGFLSLRTPMIQIPLGNGKYRLDIDMFGTDLECAQTHVLYQLREAVNSLPSGGSIICFIYAEKCLHKGLTSLFHGTNPFAFFKEQLILEMNV
ncbi:histidine N-acetyltransferase-like isoform 2-T2 [Pelodytes ibericus]